MLHMSKSMQSASSGTTLFLRASQLNADRCAEGFITCGSDQGCRKKTTSPPSIL